MLTRFRAKNYKNVDCNVELGPVNVLIGPNNSGKSNFLKALGFASDLVNTSATPGRHLVETVDSHGGTLNVGRRGSVGPVELGWWHRSSERRSLSYELAFKPDSSGIRVEVTAERLNREASGSRLDLSLHEGAVGEGTLRIDGHTSPVTARPDLDFFHQGSVLATGGKPAFVAAAHFQAVFADEVRLRRFANFKPADLSAPNTSATTDNVLDERGLNLANVLRDFEQAEDTTVFSALNERLREVLPNLRRLWVRDAGGTHRWVNLSFGPQQDYALAQMSDGTALILALATLLSAPVETLGLDEPEINLHPAWLRVVGRWLQTARQQILVSTHSPDLLDTFTEGFREGRVRLLVFAPQGTEGPTVRVAAPEDLESFFAEGWELGDLYRVGEPKLGGWPW